MEVRGLYHGQRDFAASPLHYTGAGWELGLAWRRPNPESRLSVTASFGMGDLRSRLTTGSVHGEELFLARVGARYLRRVATLGDDRLVVLAGADLTTHAAGRFHRYVENGGEEVFADVLAPLSAVAGWEWAGRVRVGQRLLIPAAGAVVRNPYGGLKYAPDVKIVAPGSLTGFGHELFVETGAAAVLDVRVGWSLSVLHHHDPRSLDLATHRFFVGGSFHGRGTP